MMAQTEMRGRSWRAAVWGGAAALMLAPAAATRLTDEMAWDSTDFLVFGIMLAAICGAWELAMLKSKNRTFAAGAVVAAAGAVLLVLVNGAVGFIGNEDNRVNLLFFGVLSLALGGAIAVRFRAEGLARVMAVTAGAQLVAAALAVALVPDVRGFLLGTAMFVPIWLLSAWLFARAARSEG